MSMGADNMDVDFYCEHENYKLIASNNWQTEDTTRQLGESLDEHDDYLIWQQPFNLNRPLPLREDEVFEFDQGLHDKIMEPFYIICNRTDILMVYVVRP